MIDFEKWFDEWRQKDLNGLGKLIERGKSIHQAKDFKVRLIKGMKQAGFSVLSQSERAKELAEFAFDEVIDSLNRINSEEGENSINAIKLRVSKEALRWLKEREGNSVHVGLRVDNNPTFKRQGGASPPVPNNYKCGHQGKPVIMDGNPLSLAHYLNWAESKGFNGTREQCFECYCKKEREAKTE